MGQRNHRQNLVGADGVAVEAVDELMRIIIIVIITDRLMDILMDTAMHHQTENVTTASTTFAAGAPTELVEAQKCAPRREIRRPAITLSHKAEEAMIQERGLLHSSLFSVPFG